MVASTVRRSLLEFVVRSVPGLTRFDFENRVASFLAVGAVLALAGLVVGVDFTASFAALFARADRGLVSQSMAL